MIKKQQKDWGTGMVQGNKLLAIGLDAGDLDFIRSRGDRLPALRKLANSKFLFRPAAPKALSGSVWPTFYTGSHPGHHGIYQHLVWDAQRMGLRRIGPGWCRCRPFWADLEARGRKVTVFDVPYTFPGSLKDGVEISDWGTHGQTRPMASNRQGVRKFLREFGRSPIGRETPIKKTRAQLNSIRQKLLASVDRKSDLMRALLKEFQWDVFIGVFGEIHRGGHVFYEEADALPDGSPETPLFDIYQRLDRALSRVLECVDLQRTTVVFFAVHGMMRDYGQSHLVKPVLDRLNQVFLERQMGISVPAQRAGSFVGWLRKMVPSGLQYAIGEIAPDWVRQWVVEREIVGGMDWPRTPGFALRTDVRAELRLNLAGRESRGWLEAGSPHYRAYVDSLQRAFLELKDLDTGNLLVEEMVPIPELFPGARSHALPDFSITWRPAPVAHRVSSPEIGDLEARPSGARGGDHTDFGFVAVSPSPAIETHLSSNNVPLVENIWDLGNLFMRLDELGAE